MVLLPHILLLSVSGSLGCELSFSHKTLSLRIDTKNIVVTDNASEQLICSWTGLPCHAECRKISPDNICDISQHSWNLTLNVTQSGDDIFVFSFNVSNVEYSCTIVSCAQSGIEWYVEEIAHNHSEVEGLKRLREILRACSGLLGVKLLQRCISIETVFIHSIINSTLTGPPKDYFLGDLSLTVVSVNDTTTNIMVQAPKLVVGYLQMNSSIPEEALRGLPDEERKVAVVSYESPAQFMSNQTNLRDVRSMVVRIEVAGDQVKHLREPVRMQFTVNSTHMPENSILSCLYYDEYDGGQWSDRGCHTSMGIDSRVECVCDHMTPFAVLLVDVQISQEHWEILSLISYIGCGLSMFFTMISILTYFVTRTPRTDSANSIHASLSAALFLLNLTFLSSEGIAHLTMEGLCVFWAVLLQYSLLCSFTWMAIEAGHLYLLFVRVFNPYVQHYMLKLSLLGWGMPATLIGASLIGNHFHPMYGTNEVTLSNHTSVFCWVQDHRLLYGMNVSYLSITFVLITGVLVIVSARIFKLRQVEQRRVWWMNVCTVLGLTCILGSAWGLAFFTSGYTNYTILYIFCILNSLQGFFIFLWIYGTARRARHSEASTKSSLAQSNSRNS